MGTPDSFTSGTTNNLPGNAILQAKGIYVIKMFGAPKTFDFTLTLNSNSDIAVIAEWFYLQLKNRSDQLIIDGKEIKIDKEHIQQTFSIFK